MAVRAIGFACGISVLFYLDRLPSTVLVVFLLALLVLLRLILKHAAGRTELWRGAAELLAASGVVVGFVAAGFGYAFVHAQYHQSQYLPVAYLGTEVEVTGMVASLPESRSSSLRFLLALDTLTLPASNRTHATSGSIVRLNWYGPDLPKIALGDQIRLLVKLREPSGFLNPGGFDYEKYLYQHRIVATGYVRSKPPYGNDLIQAHDSVGWLEGARNWLRVRLLQASAHLPNSGLIMALAVGDRSGIDSTQWDTFIATGTNHLLAISGLHVSLVAGFAGLLSRGIWRRSSGLQRVSRDDCCLYVATMAAFCYAAMAGFSVPTQRALLMFCVLAGLALMRRHQRRSTALSIALIAVCLFNPMSVMAPGFWMSFAAVAILYLVFAFAPRVDWRSRMLSAVRGHFLITLGLYPLTLLFFLQVSLVSPLANFIAVPIVGVLITPAVFACSVITAFSVPVASLLLVPVDYALSVVGWLLDCMAQLPLAVVKIGSVSMPAIGLIVVAALLSLLPVSGRLRWLAVIMVLPLVFPASKSPVEGGYRVTFLDVGQGTAVVVRTHSHALVYDTGAQFSQHFNAADAVIIPYLKSQGIDALDALIVSHNDNDHSGGVDELLNAIPVAQVLLSADLSTARSAKVDYCRAGDHWQWDGVFFRILHPTASDRGSENDLSCVLLVATKEGLATLLPGDIEYYGEQQLLAAGVPHAAILMAPHHGSKTSSTPAFISAVQPQHVVYTVGYANRFGFPKADIVDRYQLTGALQYHTANSGAISFGVFDGVAIEVSEYRRQQGGLWRRSADVFPVSTTLNSDYSRK